MFSTLNDTAMDEIIRNYNEKGYSIVRNFASKNEITELSKIASDLEIEGLSHHSSFRHGNFLFLIQEDPKKGKILRFCHWPCYKYPLFEKYRTDPRFLEILEPILGNNLKSLTNQIIWKTPGSVLSSYGYHQDSRFRRPMNAYRNMNSSIVQTSLAIDEHTEENGCLVVIEKSHLLGDLKYHSGKSIFNETLSESALSELGLGQYKKVNILLDPGDLVIWHPYTLHGSNSNNSNSKRRSFTNAYGIANDCDRGEWAFKNGKPIKIGSPVLIQYEDLYTKPEPHYIEGPPHPFIQKDKK